MAIPTRVCLAGSVSFLLCHKRGGGVQATVSRVSGSSKSSIINRIGLVGFRSSTKIEAVREELHRMLQRDPSGKAIVFSQFTSMLDLIAFRLQQVHSFPLQICHISGFQGTVDNCNTYHFCTIYSAFPNERDVQRRLQGPRRGFLHAVLIETCKWPTIFECSFFYAAICSPRLALLIPRCC